MLKYLQSHLNYSWRQGADKNFVGMLFLVESYFQFLNNTKTENTRGNLYCHVRLGLLGKRLILDSVIVILLPVFGCWVVTGDSLGWAVPIVLVGCIFGGVDCESPPPALGLVTPAALLGWSWTSVALGSMTLSLLESGDALKQIYQTFKACDMCKNSNCSRLNSVESTESVGYFCEKWYWKLLPLV